MFGQTLRMGSIERVYLTSSKKGVQEIQIADIEAGETTSSFARNSVLAPSELAEATMKGRFSGCSAADD